MTQLSRPLTGRTILEGIHDGQVEPPPTARLLDLELAAVGNGATTFRFTPAERFGNGSPMIHGGVLAAVADFAVATAVTTAAPEGAIVVTANLNVSYVRPARVDGPVLTCEGRVLHVGRSLAYAEASIVDDDGRLYVHATATCHVAPPPG